MINKVSAILRKHMSWIIDNTKNIVHLFRKCLMIVIGIVLLLIFGYFFGREISEPIPQTSMTFVHEVSGKIVKLEEERVVKDPYFPPRIVVWSWNGGSTIRKEQLESTILAVLLKLPMVTADVTMVELLQETAAIESRRGIHISQLNNGPARGIFQMELKTIQDTLSWMKKNYIEQYRAVRVFWNSKETEEWNFQKNVPWQIAMAASYYWRMAGNDLIKASLDRDKREKIYKKFWNTCKGKSTREKYLAMSEVYA